MRTLTFAQLNTIDIPANVTSGIVALASPALWAALGLPDDARRRAGLALLASGAMHSAAVAGDQGKGLPLASTATNAGWVLAGLSAQGLPLRPWQRGLLGAVAAYDAAMTIGKFAAGRRG